uniref:Ig-like domain-containing protein n=1 Tax=uncultured Cytophaga sp. TaxID=160238 RepID=UPI002627EC8E
YIGGANTLSISNSIVATSGPSSFCAGTSLALTSSSGASYIWKNNTTQVGITASYTTAIAGNYTVNVVSAAGCKVSSAPVVTTLHALPIITQNVKVDAGAWVAASSVTACETGTVSFGPWPTQNNGWSWTGPNNFTSSVRDPIITNLNSAHTGNYIATYIDGNGCKATSTFALIVSKPTATITTPTTSICSGGSTVLTASAGTSYKWFNGTTQVGTESTYKASSAGNYTVEVSNASGCKASSAVTQITVSTLPVATITSPTTSICSGSSVVLTASAGNSYKWYNGTTQVGSASTYTAETSGAYTVEVSNASGCKATSAVTQITVSTVPTATITSPTTSICSGGSVVLTASAGASYKWFNGTTQVGTESTYKASTAGNYSVEVSNASGCKSTSAVSQISVSTLPVATITTPITSFCSGESTVLTASAGASYKWYNSGTFVGTNQTNVANTAGNYVVEVTYTGGCKATSAVTQITVSTLPTATITSPTTSICSGSSVVLTASAGNSYKWYNGTTQVGSASTYTAETSGAYSVEVSNASGCKSTSAVSQISVSTLPAATITSPSTSFCSGGSTVLTASTGASYKWYNSGTFVGTNQTYVANSAGNYVVEVTNGSGCKTLSAGKEITITTGIVWYQDIDGDGKGDALVSKTSCNQPFGYVSIAGDACPSDAYKIDAGNCGCGKTENSCLDCAGVPNGTAVYDNCNVCVGGTTSNTACVATATTNGTTTNITVIPQPFDNLTTIKLENLGMIQNVKVFTASGALVETFSNLYVEEISLGDNLAAGLYSVIIQSENGVYTTKIVKR